MLRVQSRQCATCIYRPDSHFDVVKLEKQVADPHIPGHFRSYRICHHSKDAVCRGFWNRYKDHFAVGQVAQRLNCIEFVKDDVEPTDDDQ